MTSSARSCASVCRSFFEASPSSCGAFFRLRRLWPAAVAAGFPGGVFAGGRLGRGWALRSRAPGIRPGRRECRSSGKRSCSRANASFAEFRRRRGGRAPRWGETRFVSPPKISPAAGWTGAWIAVRCMRGGRLSWPGSCRTNFGVTLQERQNAKALRSRPSRPRFSVACGRDPSPRPPCRSRDDAPPPRAAPADGQQRRRQKNSSSGEIAVHTAIVATRRNPFEREETSSDSEHLGTRNPVPDEPPTRHLRSPS